MYLLGKNLEAMEKLLASWHPSRRAHVLFTVVLIDDAFLDHQLDETYRGAG